MKTAAAVIVRVLAGAGGPVPSTKLVKLVYFVDYIYFQHYGRTLTEFQYQWDHFGPNALGHGVIAEAHKLAEQDVVKTTCQPNIYGGETISFAARLDAELPTLSPEAEMVIQDVIHQYGRLSVSAITAKSKQTAPFKNAVQYSLLSMEQSAPAGRTTESDWDAYQRDLKENGILTLEQIKKRYRLA